MYQTSLVGAGAAKAPGKARWSIGGCACQPCLSFGPISDLPIGYNFLLATGELLGTDFRRKSAPPWQSRGRAGYTVRSPLSYCHSATVGRRDDVVERVR